MLKLSIRMRRKGDLHDFEQGLVVGLGWVDQKLLICWIFPHISQFTENGKEKKDE